MHPNAFLSGGNSKLKSYVKLALNCRSSSKTFPSAIPFTLLSTIAITISYADRSNLSTAIIPMAEEFHWDSMFSGFVLSSFWIGYALTQIMGGTLSDKFGGEKVLIFSLLAWSICTALTPTAAYTGSSFLLFIRVLLGAGEGFALPAIHSMTSKYIAPSDRSISTSVITSGCYLGALLANLFAPSVIQTYGWEVCFWSFAALPSIIWLPLWLRFTSTALPDVSLQATVAAAGLKGDTSEPMTQRLLNQSGLEERERDSELSGSGSKSGSGSGSILNLDHLQGISPVPLEDSSGSPQNAIDMPTATLFDLLSCGPVWAIILAQYSQSWGMVGLLSWLPTYFADKYDVPVGALASYTTLPYLLQLMVSVSAGYMADYLISPQRGWRIIHVRQLMQVSGMILPALLLFLCAYIPNLSVNEAAIFVTAGSALSALTVAGVSCSHFDISPRNAGAIFGIGNTAGCIGGAIAVPISGWIYDQTHSWDVVFFAFSLHYVGGAIAWMLLASDKPLLFNSTIKATK